MKTIIETATFKKQSDKIWSEDERLEFFTYLATNPTAGDVIPHAQGARKIRWTTQSQGKRGGVRVIYINHNANGDITALFIYKKNEKENMTAKEINDIK